MKGPITLILVLLNPPFLISFVHSDKLISIKHRTTVIQIHIRPIISFCRILEAFIILIWFPMQMEFNIIVKFLGVIIKFNNLR